MPEQKTDWAEMEQAFWARFGKSGAAMPLTAFEAGAEWQARVLEGQQEQLRAAAQMVVDADRVWFARLESGSDAALKAAEREVWNAIKGLRAALAASPEPESDSRLREALAVAESAMDTMLFGLAGTPARSGQISAAAIAPAVEGLRDALAQARALASPDSVVGRGEQLREALRAARDDLIAVCHSGFDSTRHEIATAAVERIDTALAASPESDPVMAAAAEKYRLEIEKARGASPEPEGEGQVDA